METDGGEIEHWPKPEVGEISYIPSASESSHCTKSKPTAEENADLPVDTLQDMKDAPSGNGSKDLGQNELSDMIVTKDKSSAGVEEICPEKNLQPDPDLETEHAASPSHDISEVADLVKAVPSPPDKNASQDKVDNQSESQSKMETEGDLGPCCGNIAETGAAEGSRSRRKCPVTSEQTEEVQHDSSFPDAATSTEPTGEAGRSFESKSPQQPGGFEQDIVVAATPNQQKMNGRLSRYADEVESESSENTEERVESTSCATPSKDEGNTEVEQSEVANAHSPLESYKSHSESSKKDDADHSETAQEDAKTPLKNNKDTEKGNDLNSQQQEAIVCKSLVDKVHLNCQQLSPMYLFPNVQLLQANPTPKKLNFSYGDELNRPQSAPTIGEVEEEVEKEEEEAGSKDSDSKQPIKRRGRKCKLASPAALSKATKRGRRKSTASPVTQSPGANGEEESQPTEDSAKATPEVIGQVCLEMGPPLPRLLTPLRTPPKADRSIHPRHAIGRLSFPSPLDGLASPATPTKDQVTSGVQHPSSSTSSSLLNSPVHPNGVRSSPLQFGSATPKHAVPVPGRLPSAAAISSSPSSSTASHSSSCSSSSPSQENSVRMLDSMYPELSAHARTLSILRGSIGSASSASTAFSKAETRGEKRPSATLAEPSSGKCPKLDDGTANGREGAPSPQPVKPCQPFTLPGPPPLDSGENGREEWIAVALKRVEKQCFDLLPVIQSHLYVGNLTKKPVMRDEEKEVIAEICQNSSVSV